MIQIKRLSKSAIIPTRGKEGDVGLDLYTSKEITLMPNETVVIPTGIAIELPYGMEAQVRPRSGISLYGCSNCVNSPYLRVILGTIDYNYRGSIGIITYNQEDFSVTVPKGTKLAQMIISNVVTDDLYDVDNLSETNRGEMGFGSSGI